MQRKTNLFYTSGQDSNFLTFSNFTEALTGNFLATDWKLYPSRFMCIYMPIFLDEEHGEEYKERFIKEYLVGYYENKLAFLRDYYTSQIGNQIITHDIEADINSLSWLFVTINKFIEDINTEENRVDDNVLDYKVTFIGDVTEFDYKGTYTDIICIIDASDGVNANNEIVNYDITFDSENSSTTYPYNENPNVLYGWQMSELLTSPYNNIVPKYDNQNSKVYYDQVGSINVTQSIDNDFIKFNLIIPLFDITDIDYRTNFDETGELIEDEYVYTAYKMIQDNILESTKEGRSVNNPLGIWFSDQMIELKRDLESKYAPSWSLIISSQFKPFPYSSNYYNNDITPKDNQQAFQTYAKILAQQSTILSNVNTLNTRVNSIESIISTINTLYDNEKLQQVLELKNLANQLQEKLNNLDNIISDEVTRQVNEKLKWK